MALDRKLALLKLHLEAKSGEIGAELSILRQAVVAFEIRFGGNTGPVVTANIEQIRATSRLECQNSPRMAAWDAQNRLGKWFQLVTMAMELGCTSLSFDEFHLYICSLKRTNRLKYVQTTYKKESTWSSYASKDVLFDNMDNLFSFLSFNEREVSDNVLLRVGRNGTEVCGRNLDGCQFNEKDENRPMNIFIRSSFAMVPCTDGAGSRISCVEASGDMHDHRPPSEWADYN